MPQAHHKCDKGHCSHWSSNNTSRLKKSYNLGYAEPKNISLGDNESLAMVMVPQLFIADYCRLKS